MAHVIKPNVAASVTTAGGHAANQLFLFMLLMLKAGWKYKASSGGGAKDVSNDPRNNKLGAPVATGAAGSSASIVAPDEAPSGFKLGYDVKVTGLTSMVAPTLTNQGGSEGRYLVFGAISGGSAPAQAGNTTIFQITKVIDANTVWARPVITPTSAVINDANNGTIGWAEYDPTTVSYVTTFTNSVWWIVLRGVEMLRMTFTTAPTGEFIRGEKVTQAATTGGAAPSEGELIGITYHPTTGAGWAIIAPRVAGTGGSAPHGWATGATITGASSGAQFTPATIVEYVTEFCFYNTDSNATTRGRGTLSSWVSPGVALDGSTEQQQLASTLAATAQCTAAIPPGCSGTAPGTAVTANGFPTLAFQWAGGAGTVGTQNWQHLSTYDSSTAPPGNMHAMVCNAIERKDRSADGTFTAMFGAPNTGGYTYAGWSFQRLDDTEEGDVWPFAMHGNQRNAFIGTGWGFGTSTRTGTNGGHPITEGAWCTIGISCDLQRATWWTWRARGVETNGVGSTDKWCPVTGTLGMASIEVNNTIFSYASYDTEKIASAAYPTMLREHPMLCNFYAGMKVRKGRPRWMAVINGAQASDTFSNRTWIQGRDSGVNDKSHIGVILGPWDGSTQPVPW